MLLSAIFIALLEGSALGALIVLLDNGVDLGDPDEKTTWFESFIHVPTAIAGLLLLVGLIIGWGFLKEGTVTTAMVMRALWTVLGAVAGAWVFSFFLKPLNAFLALLGLSVPWIQSQVVKP